MLAGMDQHVLNFIRVCIHGFDNGRDFHKIRPRTDNIDAFVKSRKNVIFQNSGLTISISYGPEISKF
jgi:hypothetical protein